MNKEYGIIVKAWQVIAVIIGFAFSTGGAYYKVLETEKKVEKTEIRLDELEIWKEKRINAEHSIELDVTDIKVKTNLMYDILVKKELENKKRR